MAASGLLSRRGFLGGTAALALAAPGIVRARPFLVSRGASPAAWRDLEQKMRGPVLFSGSDAYFTLYRPDNLRYANRFPAAIARCLDTADVATAITWARENHIPLITRSGGHSYAGYSTTNGLMIDMKLMDGVRYNDASGVVTVAGGVLNRHLYAALAQKGRTLTHGRCSSVGAAGFLLGGGIGFNMRQYGIASDSMTRTTMVKADGTVLDMSAAENPAEFWACRGGGGGNFGISTEFSVRTEAVPDRLTVFSMQWNSPNAQTAAALMQALSNGPDRLGTRVSIRAVNPKRAGAHKGVLIDLLGQLKGTKAEFLDIIKKVPRATVSDIRETTYWAGQKFLTELPAPTYYQERSAFVDQAVPVKILQTGFKDFLHRWPGVSGTCDLRFFQTGQAVNALKPGETAFAHRSSEWLMVIGLYWDEADNARPAVMSRAHGWQNDFYRAVRPYSDGGAYQNFPDPSLADWRQAYYAGNYDRLVKVKHRLDPYKVFDFPQAIWD